MKEVVFKDNKVTQGERTLLSFDNVNNKTLYELIRFLLDNEDSIVFIKDSTTPLSEKLYEIITEEFNSKDKSSQW